MIIKNKYEIGQQVSSDNFGFVYQGKSLQSGMELSFRQYLPAFKTRDLKNIADLAYKISVLQHSSIVKIIDVFFGVEGELWLVYDTPYEGDLQQFIDKISRLNLESSLEIINELGRTLEYAHQKGIIHGGVNPHNIWIMKNGKVKLVNFAIDHLLNFYELQNNNLLLTTSFMPPEQLKKVTINRTTDTFSMAALLYRLLSGQNPYPQIKDKQMHLHNLLREPAPLTLLTGEVPKYIEDIVMKSLSKEPRLRHHSAAEFLGDIKAKKVTLQVTEAMKKIEKLDTIQQHTINKKEQRTEKKPMTKNNDHQPLVEEDKPKTPENSKKKSSHEVHLDGKKLLRALVILAVLIGVLFAIIQALFVGYFSSVPTIYVPEVSNIPVSEARSVLAQSGLRSKITAYTPSMGVSQNYVIETIPAAGRTVKKNRLIKLILSKGSEVNKSPLLKGKSVAQAEALLKENGFYLRISNYVYDLQNPANIILDQDPAEGEMLEAGMTVNVTISKGFPVAVSLIDDNFVTRKVMLSVQVPKGWDEHLIEVIVNDSRGERKIIEKNLRAEEELIKDLDLESSAYLEVYANNELVLKQNISEI